MRDEQLGDRQKSADMSLNEMEELLRAKESQIQRLREANQKYEVGFANTFLKNPHYFKNRLQMEVEELQVRFQSEHNAEREQELENLRLELVEATKIARQLLGESLVGPTDSDPHSQAADLSGQLRLRVVQINRELDLCRQQLRGNEEEKTQLTRAIEQKDAQLAQHYAELERIRKVIFFGVLWRDFFKKYRKYKRL